MAGKQTYGARPPAFSETCAVLRTNEVKRSALLFDRIYVNSRNEVFFDTPTELTFGIEEVDDYIEYLVDQRKAEFENEMRKNPSLSFEEGISRFQRFLDRSILQAYAEKKGIEVIPIYSSQDRFVATFGTGQAAMFQAALNNLPVVDESGVSWKQILEFREDKEAVKKYRDLRLWLRDGLSAKSINEATDKISQKIDDYEWAIKKFGFKTVTGALSSILDWEGLTAIIGGTVISAAALLWDPTAAAIAGGVVIAGKISVWWANSLIEHQDIKRGPNLEVAYIYESRKQFQ